jgi:nucleoid-associated protein YgaU
MKRVLFLAALLVPAVVGCARAPHPSFVADPSQGTFYTNDEIRGLSAAERQAYCASLDRQVADLHLDVDRIMVRADSLTKATDSLKAANQALTTTIRDLDTKVRQARLARRAATTYLVKAGDTIQSISAQVYGEPGQWQKIYDANKDLIGDSKKQLSPGIRLTIPAK